MYGKGFIEHGPKLKIGPKLENRPKHESSGLGPRFLCGLWAWALDGISSLGWASGFYIVDGFFFFFLELMGFLGLEWMI
jgi:hypothetical protein